MKSKHVLPINKKVAHFVVVHVSFFCRTCFNYIKVHLIVHKVKFKDKESKVIPESPRAPWEPHPCPPPWCWSR